MACCMAAIVLVDSVRSIGLVAVAIVLNRSGMFGTPLTV